MGILAFSSDFRGNISHLSLYIMLAVSFEYMSFIVLKLFLLFLGYFF